MNSFVFWLSVAAAVGAILGLALPVSVPEILISLVAINAVFYGVRGWRRPHWVAK